VINRTEIFDLMEPASLFLDFHSGNNASLKDVLGMVETICPLLISPCRSHIALPCVPEHSGRGKDLDPSKPTSQAMPTMATCILSCFPPIPGTVQLK
jgi:hypothetical protein